MVPPGTADIFGQLARVVCAFDPACQPTLQTRFVLTSRIVKGTDKGHARSEPPPAPQLGHATTQLGPAALRPAPDPLIGQVIAERYRILRSLAEGGMGVVYVAEHLSLHKEVALKLIRREYAAHEEVLTRFAREALATAQFEHPHVVSAIDYGSLAEGNAYFVMQLVRGRSLRALLQERGALPYRRVCSLGAQIADALSAAHASGIIHRDLKPENILVETRDDGSDLVKILDFGIARIDSQLDNAPSDARPGQALTRVGMVMGTPGYMAPEQALGDTLDHRADLYALGVVLWESLAGRDLWSGEDFTALVTRQMSEDPPLTRTQGGDPECPEALEALIQALLARNPDDRPALPGAVRDELRALSLTDRVRSIHPLVNVEQQARKAWDNARSQTLSWLGTKPNLRRVVLRTAQALRPWPRVLHAAVGAILLLVLGVSLLPGDTEPEPLPQGTPEAKSVTADPSIPSTSAAPISTQKTASTPPVQPQGAPQPTRKNVVHSVVSAAVDAIRGEKALPAELVDAHETLFNHDSLRRRRIAAREVLSYKRRADIPAHVLAVAELEAARNCTNRRRALETIIQLKDPRTRTSVERYHDSRTGCGFLSTQDCYECNRRDLARALAVLSP